MGMATAMVTVMDRQRPNDRASYIRNMMKVARIILTAAVSLGVAYGAFSAAFVGIVASANPPVALKVKANDPIALAAKADAMALHGLSLENSGEYRRLATASVTAQALNPRALRLLAMAPEQGMPDKKRWALLDLSHRLSRRDIGTQLLLIEKNAQTDAIAQTLKHYDIALTTDEGSADVLFPVLASAIEDEAINREFSSYLPSKQPWMDAFIRFKLDRDKKSNALTKTANAARVKPQGLAFGEMKQYLFERSVRTGNYAAAKIFHKKYAVSDAALLTSGDFQPAEQSRYDFLLRWRLFELPYILPQISRESVSSPYQLTVEASSNARGTVATKLLMLQPGRYRLAIEYGDVKFTPSSFATWMLRCVGMGEDPVVWTTNVTSAVSTSAMVTIPPTCGAQTVELLMSSGADQQDSILAVKKVSFTRAE
jgi:hypothetical protein